VQTCSLCHCHSLSLALVKSRWVLPFWYRLTWVVLEKGLLYGCVCVVLAVIVISLLDNSLQMSVSCETPCYQEKRLSVLVSNSFPEAGHFRVLLIEVSGGFPGYGAAVESISKPQGMCTES